jgi:hypothetical protein
MMDIRKIRIFNVPYGVQLAIVVGLVDSDASGWQIAVATKTRRAALWRVCTSVTHSDGKFDKSGSRMEVIGGRKEGVHCARLTRSTRV